MLMPLLLLAQNAASLDQALAEHRARTSVAIPCRAPANPDEVVICAGRTADRYRVPLVTADAGREADGVRLARLLDTAPPPCGEGAFLVKCGKVGVSATITSGGEIRSQLRPLAP